MDNEQELSAIQKPDLEHGGRIKEYKVNVKNRQCIESVKSLKSQLPRNIPKVYIRFLSELGKWLEENS